MKDEKRLSISAEKIAIGILIILAGINAIWAVSTEYSGPLIALFFYTFLTFLCWGRRHFQAGIIGGVLGLVIHIYELLHLGVRGLEKGTLVFFCANLVLPILLICFSYKAHQETV